MYDYSGILENIVLPKLMDTRFVKPLNDLYALGTMDSKRYGGSRITQKIQTAYTGTARNVTRADVDGNGGVAEYATAYWEKLYSDSFAEIHNIDILEAANGGFDQVVSLIEKEVSDALDDLKEKIYDNCYAQIKLDLGTSTYSDAALNRTTYPSLATGYTEATDTAITVAYLRACQDGVKLNELGTDPRNYTFSMGPAVFTKARVAIATNTGTVWNTQNQPGGVEGGYGPILNFEGTPIREVQGFTTGDVMYTRKQDLMFHEHAPFRREVKPSGRDSVKIGLYMGVNAYCLNPAKNGFMTNKD